MAKFSPAAIRGLAGKATVASLNKQSGVIGKAGKALNDMIHNHALEIMVFIHEKGAGNRTPATTLVQNIHSKSMKMALVKWFVKHAGCAWDETKQAFTGERKDGKPVKFELTDEKIADANANPFWMDKDNAATGKITLLNEQDLIAQLYLKLATQYKLGLRTVAPKTVDDDEKSDVISEKSINALYSLLSKAKKADVDKKLAAVGNDNANEAPKAVEVNKREKAPAKAA